MIKCPNHDLCQDNLIDEDGELEIEGINNDISFCCTKDDCRYFINRYQDDNEYTLSYDYTPISKYKGDFHQMIKHFTRVVRMRAFW
jgi:hypothetical protein